MRNLETYRRFGFHEVRRENLDVSESPTIVWLEKTL